MKKSFFIICCLFGTLSTAGLQAQTTLGLRVASGVSYIKSGLKMYHWYGTSDPLLTYSLGVSVHRRWFSRLEGSLELQGARRGGYFYIRNYFTLPSITAKRTWFNISLNALSALEWRKELKKKRYRTFAIQAGLNAGFNFANRWKYGGEPVRSVDSESKPLDVGVIVGMKATQKLRKKGVIGLDFRYYQGLTDLSKSDDETWSRVFELGLFYVFSKK